MAVLRMMNSLSHVLSLLNPSEEKKHTLQLGPVPGRLGKVIYFGILGNETHKMLHCGREGKRLQTCEFGLLIILSRQPTAGTGAIT